MIPRLRHPLVQLIVLGSVAFGFPAASFGHGAEHAEKPALANASHEEMQQFNDAFETRLSEFESDLKAGKVFRLKSVAIRSVTTSARILSSYRSQIELRVTEKILKNTKARVVHCLACRTLKSGDESRAELQRIATLSGIENFMDISLTEEASGVVLSIQVTHASDGGVEWLKRYSNVSEQPESIDSHSRHLPVRIMESVFYVNTPNEYSGRYSLVGLGFTINHPYGHQQKEIGGEANYYFSTSNLYSYFNLSLMLRHGWSIFGQEESIRLSPGLIFLGLGGTYVTGYWGALFRAGCEWHASRHWYLNFFAGARTAPRFGPETGIGLSYGF